jgi:hypothetical protein
MSPPAAAKQICMGPPVRGVVAVASQVSQAARVSAQPPRRVAGWQRVLRHRAGVAAAAALSSASGPECGVQQSFCKDSILHQGLKRERGGVPPAAALPAASRTECGGQE